MKIGNKSVIHIIMLLLLILLLPIILIFSRVMGNKETVAVSDSDANVEITFTSSWAGTDTKSNGLKKIIEGFEAENPNIIINNKSISGEEFLFTLKTDFAQGNDPDVFGLWPGSDINSLVDTGKVADITSDLENDKEWMDSFGSDAWAYDRVDNRIYGLPCEIIYEGLFINRDLFDKYNVNVPKTYEDLVEAVKTFRAKGIIPIAYNSTAEGTYIYQNIVASLGGKANVEHPIVNGCFNECFVKGMYYMRDLYNKGAFPKEAFIHYQ